MGLDMYLRAERYVGGWDHYADAQRVQYRQLIQTASLDALATHESPSVTVSVPVAYWRKAWAIHNWFVANCADGHDRCDPVYVGEEKALQLVQLCERLLSSRDALDAITQLPVNDDMDEDDVDDEYWDDLKDTVKMIRGVLSNPQLKGCTLYYHGSW